MWEGQIQGNHFKFHYSDITWASRVSQIRQLDCLFNRLSRLTLWQRKHQRSALLTFCERITFTSGPAVISYRPVSNIRRACRRCSNYIFILDLTLGFIGWGKDNCKLRREAFTFGELVRLILESSRHVSHDPSCASHIIQPALSLLHNVCGCGFRWIALEWLNILQVDQRDYFRRSSIVCVPIKLSLDRYLNTTLSVRFLSSYFYL